MKVTTLDNLVDRLLPKLPDTKRQERAARLKFELGAAWNGLPVKPKDLWQLVDARYGRATSSAERVRGLVHVLATGVQNRKDRYTVDVRSAKLKYDRRKLPYIQVRVIGASYTFDFYPSKSMMQYINNP